MDGEQEGGRERGGKKRGRGERGYERCVYTTRVVELCCHGCQIPPSCAFHPHVA